jgi:hypothetical protein
MNHERERGHEAIKITLEQEFYENVAFERRWERTKEMALFVHFLAPDHGYIAITKVSIALH